MGVGEKIKTLRLSKGLSQNKLAKMAGVSQAGLSAIESTTKSPSTQTISQIAQALGVPLHTLLNDFDERLLPNNAEPLPGMKQVPLLGTIPCGQPSLAVENADELVPVPDTIHAHFALRCTGDSMTGAGIYDGDLVYIRQQEMVENGEIAAVLIEEDATLKRVRIFDDMIILEPANPLYQPIVYRGDDMNAVRILGKAVGFTRLFK